MECRGLCEEGKIWSPCDESDEEEALSFCDLPSAELSAEWESTLRDSNPESSDDFDFDFSGSSSIACHTCPADDLFHGGRLLPLRLHRCTSESNARSLCTKSSSNPRDEKSFLLNEKLQAWRTDSLDSQSSYWTSSSSNNSQASHRSLNASEKGFRPVNSATPGGKSKSKSNRTSGASSKPAPSTSLKWPQIFSLGLIKTPPMKLEDMRLRQREKPILKPSVSCSDDERQKVPRTVNSQHKSKSVKENMSVEEPPRARGWSKLAPLTSLNGCKACTDSVIICHTEKKRVDGGGPAGSTKLQTKNLPVYADQNSPNSSGSNSSGGGLVLGSTAKSNKVESHRLSFKNSTLLCI